MGVVDGGVNALFYLQSRILSLFFDKLQAVETREVDQFGKWNNKTLANYESGEGEEKDALRNDELEGI